MRRLLPAVSAAILLCAAIAPAGAGGLDSHRADTTGGGTRATTGLTAGSDPFRAGDQVVRDRATGRPLYRVKPDPFHAGSQQVDDYNTEQPVGEIRPDPFNPDQSVIHNQ